MTVWELAEAATAGEWCQRLREAEAEIGAVISADQEGLFEALVDQLGKADLVCSFSPVSDAIKVVVDGLVVDSVDRTGLFELRPPFAFRITAALDVIAPLDPDHPIDLLATLAAFLHPVPFLP